MRYEVKEFMTNNGGKFKVLDLLREVYLSPVFDFYDDAFNAAMGYADIKKARHDEFKWLLHKRLSGCDVGYKLGYQLYQLGGLGGVW